MAAALPGRRRGGFREINVTPLVDVMLVLLVVFMVTAPLLTTGLRIDLPEVKAAETPVRDARLLVTVTRDERILFGEDDVTGHIDQALKDNARVQRERELYIRADKDARYGVVALVVAAARNSGVDSLNLLVQPELEEVPDGDHPSDNAEKAEEAEKAEKAPGNTKAPGRSETRAPGRSETRAPSRTKDVEAR